MSFQAICFLGQCILVWEGTPRVHDTHPPCTQHALNTHPKRAGHIHDST